MTDKHACNKIEKKPYILIERKDRKMNKLNIAVFFGGCSSEYSISLESAYSVIHSMNREKYNPVMIGITQKGSWYYYEGDERKIKSDAWFNEYECTSALLSPDKGAQKLLVLRKDGIEYIKIDAALPVLHGRNGEDGTIQGLIELSGIPLIGCGTLSSALCMDKDRAHRLAGEAGVKIPTAAVLTPETPLSFASQFAAEIGYPLYVKPVKAGSSYGVTRVEAPEQLSDAVALAFQYDNQVIIENNIEGFEVGCAVLGNETLLVGEVDEIELSAGFFDFTEKYTLKTSAIHVPARISKEKSDEIKETAKIVYRALGCTGFARVDLFLKPDGTIVFNEINTIPGFTEHSRYPGMMKAAGYSFDEVIERIINLALKYE